MKHTKKLFALLLVFALALALVVPAFAADEDNPAFWERVTSKLQCLWEECKAMVREVLIWAGIIERPPPPIILYKPVIYLYPERPAQVRVTLQTRDAHLIESIPAYREGWRVLAQPDGTLTDLDGGGVYPYLFWEAALDAPWPEPEEGFIVARDDLAGFLGEKLRFLGLNDAEAGEFIEFWLPKLARNAYTLIHFSNTYYDERFPLEISPAPDSVLRVFMVARAATENESIDTQALAPFERRGFAAVEWGGMIF